MFRELEDVLVALAVSGAGRVGVRQLVHQDELRLPRDHGVRVHLLERLSPVGERHPGNELEVGCQGIRLFPLVALQVPDDDVRPLQPLTLRLLEHRVGLPHPGSHAEKDFDFSFSLAPLFDHFQKRVGIGALFIVDWHRQAPR